MIAGSLLLFIPVSPLTGTVYAWNVVGAQELSVECICEHKARSLDHVVE